MKTKTIFLLIFLILVLIIIFVIKNSSQKSEGELIKKVEQTPSPALETFQLISSNLTSSELGITEPISLEFNQPISSNFVYTLEPQKEVKIYSGSNPNEIIIDPVDAWAFNTDYTLRILKSTSSATGRVLDKDYIYTSKTPPYSGI